MGSGPEGVQVRDVTGRTEGDAEGLLQGDGFKVSSTERGLEHRAQGPRDPHRAAAPARSRPKGATITIVVSSGPEVSEVTVPNVVGLSEANATAVLEGKRASMVEVDEFRRPSTRARTAR